MICPKPAAHSNGYRVRRAGPLPRKFRTLRSHPSSARRQARSAGRCGEIDSVFSSAAQVVEAESERPFQSHASMGPACAVVDARTDGATLWTGSQKVVLRARDGVAWVLGPPPDRCTGSGSLGSRVDIDTNESDPAYSLAGQLIAMPLKPLQGFGVPDESDGFANKRLAWETIPPLLDRASPSRTAHLRDPVGPQIQFASESFIDEIAATVGADPVAFRLRHLKAPRDIAVVKAAAERAGRQRRPSPSPDRNGDTLVGRGIAYAQRSGAVVAIVAQVEIDRRSGKIWARKFIAPMIAG